MAKRVDLLNQPYRPILTISKEKVDSLFSIMNSMDTQQIKQFSMVNNIPLNVDDINGENLIHKAINIENTLKKEFHRLNIIKFLVQNSVNPDKPNKENQTPLHLACKYQYSEIVEYLISLGVNVNYQDNYGATPFHYALQGQIKLLEPEKSLKDFIPPQKKVDASRKEELLKIKKDIWELIKNESFISSIKNTVDNSIYSDENIKNRSLKLYKKLSEKTLETEPANYLKSMKEEIDIFRNSIKNVVESKWSNFPESADIDIHEKQLTSYDFSGNTLSTLKNINIKKKIRDDIQKNRDDVRRACKDVYESVEKLGIFRLSQNNLIIIGNTLAKLNEEDNRLFRNTAARGAPLGKYVINNNPFTVFENKWNSLNASLLHKNAIDFADNIIDWNNLTFMGGSREIDLLCNFANITSILNLTDEREKVYYILANFTPLEINGNTLVQQGGINFDRNDVTAYTNAIAITELEKLKIRMAYNAIFNLEPPTPPAPPVVYPSDLKIFYDKWAPLISYKDKFSAIYAMYCAVACFNSNDNLTGQLSCEVPMLISALKLSDRSINDAIKTSMKKYFIEEKMNDIDPSKTTLNKLFASLNILLDETLDNGKDYYDTTLNSDINTKLNEIITLFGTVPLDSETKYNKFYELITLITSKVNKMKNKPLVQDVISLLTYLSNSCFIDNGDCNGTYYKISDLPRAADILRGVILDNFSPNVYENDMLYIIKNRNNMHIIPYLNALIESETVTDLPGRLDLLKDRVRAFNLLKLKESKHLGLYFKGLIKNPYEENTMTKFRDGEGNTFQITQSIIIPGPGGHTEPTLHHTFRTVVHPTIAGKNIVNIDDGQLPLIGNYLIEERVAAPAVPLDLNYNTNNNVDLKFFKYVDHKYRPPIGDFKIDDKKSSPGLITMTNEYINYKIKKLLQMVLYSGLSDNNLYTLIDSNTKLSKSFTEYYSYITFIFDLLTEDSLKQKLDQIVSLMNKYNGNLLMYYYLFSPDKIYKIPSFNYYELPLPSTSNKGRFLYFQSNDVLDLNNLPSDDGSPETVVRDLSNNIYINIRGANTYLDVYRNIEANIITGKYVIRNESLKQSKEKRLPPSLVSVLNTFYLNNINLLLQGLYSKPETTSIISDLKQLRMYEDDGNNIIDEKIGSYFLFSKIVEELVKQQMVYYIQSQTYRILNEAIKGKFSPSEIDGLTLAPQDFSLSMNKTNINLDDFRDSNKEYLLSSYQFSKVEELDNDKIIIYPDEYSNSELLKSKYELKINEKIYKSLFESHVNPYILDSNNQSAIFPLLKTHIPGVIGSLKRNDLDYREFTDIKPYEFLLFELENHTNKLTNNSNKFEEWLENFVSYQKMEVKTLILSNDKFGNNVPLYLEDSFNIIAYIVNQYLGESTNKYYNYKDLFGSDFKYNPANYLFINEKANTLGVYDKEESNIIYQTIQNNEIEIKKLEKNIAKLADGNTKIKLLDKIQKLKDDKTKLSGLIDGNNLTPNPTLSQKKILQRYIDFQSLNGISTVALSKYIKSDINESLDLLTFKVILKENTIFKDNMDTSKLTTLSNISKFYLESNKISDIYFTFGKYGDNNKVLAFAKELLEFMTCRFICYPYLMLLRKVLTAYFTSIYPKDTFDEILEKVKFCLTNDLLKEDEKSIEKVLYEKVSKSLVLNSVQIFDNESEEYLFNNQSIKDILDTVVNLLTVNPTLSIPESSPFFRTTIKEINAYFDTFVSKTILNWLVVIENVFKFNINQGRIIQSIEKLLN
jgi:hypothetical protein